MQACTYDKMILFSDTPDLTPAAQDLNQQHIKSAGAVGILQGSGIGHAAVHWCAAKGHLTCLQWLLQQEADINCLNAEDSTPLHAAAANGQQDIVLFLLDQSATKGNDSFWPALQSHAKPKILLVGKANVCQKQSKLYSGLLCGLLHSQTHIGAHATKSAKCRFAQSTATSSTVPVACTVEHWYQLLSQLQCLELL